MKMKKIVLLPGIIVMTWIIACSEGGGGGGEGLALLGLLGGDTPPAVINITDVLFAYGNSSTDTAILRMNDTMPITTTEIVPADASADRILLALPSTSLDRSKLAYLYSNDTTYSGSSVKFLNSGVTIDITPSNFDFSGDFSMVLSPDGSKLAYVDFNYDSSSNPNYHIWVIPTDSTGATPVQITNCASGIDKYPTWSPDGKQIAFVHFDADYNAKIYKVKADGSSATSYGAVLFSWDTTSPANESLIHLAWSPTNPYQMVCSSRISGTNPKFFIYTLNLRTKERTKLTDNTTQPELYPHWSKDGNYIFYEINKNIYYNSIDNSGNSGTQMTTDGMSSFYGWAPS